MGPDAAAGPPRGNRAAPVTEGLAASRSSQSWAEGTTIGG
jgi:hypothetical protein